VDLSEHGLGLAILTDSTYGYSVLGSDMRVSLLRAPTDPDPDADQGSHELTYALVPHTGGWQEAGVVREARLLNEPLHWTEGAREPGGLVAVESGELVLDSIKRAEDGEALVLRLYEPHGGRGTARVRLGFPFRSARLANALEEPLADGEIESQGEVIELAYRPFELITILAD
jgi:alpha-mannosidase